MCVCVCGGLQVCLGMKLNVSYMLSSRKVCLKRLINNIVLNIDFIENLWSQKIKYFKSELVLNK